MVEQLPHLPVFKVRKLEGTKVKQLHQNNLKKFSLPTDQETQNHSQPVAVKPPSPIRTTTDSDDEEKTHNQNTWTSFSEF